MLVVSSTLFIMALLTTISITLFQWKIVFFVYCIIFSPLLIHYRALPLPEVKARAVSKIDLVAWRLSLGFIRGIPPIPAFLLKVEILLVLLISSESYAAWGFLMAGVAMLSLYTSLLLKGLNTAHWVFRTRALPLSPGLALFLVRGLTTILWA